MFLTNSPQVESVKFSETPVDDSFQLFQVAHLFREVIIGRSLFVSDQTSCGLLHTYWDRN